MIIENKNTTVRINQTRLILLIIFIPLILVMSTTDIMGRTIMGMNKYYWVIFLTLIYIIYNIYEYIKDFNYIYFSDEDEEGKLILRYISLRPFKGRRFSIEIEKEKFYAYKIVRALFNLNKYIILYINTPQGVAKYPPISITALNTDEYNKLKKALYQYANKDKD